MERLKHFLSVFVNYKHHLPKLQDFHFVNRQKLVHHASDVTAPDIQSLLRVLQNGVLRVAEGLAARSANVALCTAHRAVSANVDVATERALIRHSRCVFLRSQKLAYGSIIAAFAIRTGVRQLLCYGTEEALLLSL